MLNFVKKKYTRFLSSSKILKINFIFHKYFGEKDIGEIGFSFKDKPNRYQIIQEIILKKQYKTYLEIGCFAGEVFNKIKIKKKIGVDPVSGGTIRKTSDEFFKTNDKKFDLVFIDGLHTYEQVKKDIINSIDCLKENGVVLVHDCMPDCMSKQAVPRYRMTWNGDVWKAIVDLRHNGDLNIYTCEIDQGIGIIKKEKNTSILKIDKKIKDLKFKDYYENYNQYLRVININEFKKMF